MAPGPVIDKLLLSEQPARILICDDDADIRAIIKLTLTERGHVVTEAEDGMQARDLFVEYDFDLVLMDVMMPRMSGTEFVRWLRQARPGEFIPVLMLTALSDVADRVNGLEAGADDYVTKPFDYRELEARVRALLRSRRLMARIVEMQQTLIDKERQIAAMQLAGTAAHNMGQPLSTVLLNCKLIDAVLQDIEPAKDDSALGSKIAKLQQAVVQIKQQCEEAKGVLNGLQNVQVTHSASYVGNTQIFELEKSSK